MNFTELSQEAREMQDRIERMNANIEWLKQDTERQFSSPVEQIKQQQAAPSKKEITQLTPEQGVQPGGRVEGNVAIPPLSSETVLAVKLSDSLTRTARLQNRT